MITFDNQLSTGIQAFGHCGSPTCTMTSAFGANEPYKAPAPSVEPDRSLVEKLTDTGSDFNFIPVPLILVGLVLFFTMSSKGKK